ncbi:uncharacterized protein IUM83_12290 [Phytophthora cinnamomi]|uniref:uncharacterized protein n=1 Tax=Phytophthora cinnamomi TaxID=4785 RepID=UPI00355A9C13|nr:hypothetical protein IUM83_12290 [Phytophthora cinnamomi]
MKSQKRLRLAPPTWTVILQPQEHFRKTRQPPPPLPSAHHLEQKPENHQEPPPKTHGYHLDEKKTYESHEKKIYGIHE